MLTDGIQVRCPCGNADCQEEAITERCKRNHYWRMPATVDGGSGPESTTIHDERERYHG